MKFWIGSNDVGPHGFSGLTYINAASLDEAKQKAEIRFGGLPIDPRRKDKTLRLAIVPESEMASIPGGTSPGGLRVPSKYIVECKQ
jgi:hypothetical protein